MELSRTFDFYTGPDPTKFVRSIHRGFTGTDARLQRISDVSLNIYEST